MLIIWLEHLLIIETALMAGSKYLRFPAEISEGIYEVNLHFHPRPLIGLPTRCSRRMRKVVILALA